MVYQPKQSFKIMLSLLQLQCRLLLCIHPFCFHCQCNYFTPHLFTPPHPPLHWLIACTCCDIAFLWNSCFVYMYTDILSSFWVTVFVFFFFFFFYKSDYRRGYVRVQGRCHVALQCEGGYQCIHIFLEEGRYSSGGPPSRREAEIHSAWKWQFGDLKSMWVNLNSGPEKTTTSLSDTSRNW